MTYQCPMCRARGKTWEGEDPRCAFNEAGEFQADNWNCATMNALRDIAEESAVGSVDHAVAAIPVDYDGVDDPCAVTHVALNWYKHRGATPLALEINDYHLSHPLRLCVAEVAIAQHANVRGQKGQ